MISFNLYYCIISTLVTLLPFIWIKNEKDEIKKYFYIFCVFFYYLICGATSYLFSDNNYIVYYVVYTLAFSSALYFTRNTRIKLRVFSSAEFESFINKKAGIFIKFYFLFQFLQLIYPTNKLGNLISLGHPDVNAALETSLEHSMFDTLGQILGLMFYIFLSKYVNNPAKLIKILLFSTYLSYASSSYLSRGAILRLLVVVFFLFYINYPKIRKILLLSAIGSVSFLLIFFVSYMYARSGGAFEAVSLSTAVEKIVEIELSFSYNFETVLSVSKIPRIGIWQFFLWFVTLPLPGFMKPGVLSESMNVLYTYDVLGLDIDDVSFFVTLPGLAIEGVYLFGLYLYPLHAILFAVMINCLINTLRQSSVFSFLCIYYIINIPFQAIRGGTQSFYATCLKIIPFVLILLYIWFKQTKKSS